MMTGTDTMYERFAEIRSQTTKLTEGLSAEDLLAQSMADASPGKWHLAHTTWFFETFILQHFSDSYREFHPQFNFLFNSYYENVGKRHARPQRGLLTRPSLDEILAYRRYVDEAMLQLLQQTCNSDVESRIIIGLHHEMQHQELFLTDILNLLSYNPLLPKVLQKKVVKQNQVSNQHNQSEMTFIKVEGGLTECGCLQHDEAQWQDFAYDCEQPAHTVYVQNFQLASRLVNNAEWLAFINDGGYSNPLLWLADGWAACQREQWQAPLYWQQREGQWCQFGLDGLHEIGLTAPVCHISFYEADAFARWAGKRLPTEFEWETVAKQKNVNGNFLENYHWRPQGAREDFADMYGDVWEWTSSAFSPYPKFQAKQGALGEYNGKFMANQFVLRGGSCVTPQQQIRPTYRNFFYPQHRWQFSGVRLAEDS